MPNIVPLHSHFNSRPSEDGTDFRKMLQGTRCLVLHMDPGGDLLFMNAYARQFFGLKTEEMTGQNVLDLLLPKDAADYSKLQSMIDGIAKNPERYANMEMQTQNCYGERKWVLWTNTPILDGRNRITGILSMGNDISERKSDEDILLGCCSNLRKKVEKDNAQLRKAYEKLRKEIQERRWAEEVLQLSEEKYRLVVENANEAIVIVQDHHIRFFNPKTLKVLNLPLEQISTDSLDDIIHPEDRDMARERRLKMLRGESVSAIYQLRTVDREGTTRWQEVNSVLISWMGRPAILAFFTNITERKKAEFAIETYQTQLRSLASELSLVEEQERRRIATGLHDHIGQTLAITKIKLGALGTRLNTEAEKEEIIFIRSLLDQTIDYTKTLTFQLSPPILYELGFEAAMEWLGEEVQKNHSLRFHFENDEAEKPLSENVSVLLFQAVRELVMNIIKHAEARMLKISVQREKQMILLLVADDGKGFNSMEINPTSFGLFSVRERMNHLGGTFEIESSPGQGTTMVLKAPLLTAVEEGAQNENPCPPGG